MSYRKGRKYIVMHGTPERGYDTQFFTAPSKREIRKNLRAAGLTIDSKLSIERC